MGKRVSPQRGSAREDERASKLQGAEVTAARHKVGAVVCVKAKDMKDPWCLAASNAEATAANQRERRTWILRLEPGARGE